MVLISCDKNLTKNIVIKKNNNKIFKILKNFFTLLFFNKKKIFFLSIRIRFPF